MNNGYNNDHYSLCCFQNIFLISKMLELISVVAILSVIILFWLHYCLCCVLQEDRVQAILEGHTGPVNCAEFCPHYTSTIVTAGDDRTFKVSGTHTHTHTHTHSKFNNCYICIYFMEYMHRFQCLFITINDNDDAEHLKSTVNDNINMNNSKT